MDSVGYMCVTALIYIIIRLDSFIVAKIYDPMFAPEDENWKGHRAKRFVQLKDYEIRAYSKLVQLQGRDIPELCIRGISC